MALWKALQPWDLKLYQWINTHLTHPRLDPLASLLSSHVFWLGVFVFALAVLLLRRHWPGARLCLAIALAVGVTDASSTYVLKPYFKRVRPCHWVENARRVGDICGSTYGMPSNHAANGAAATGLLWQAGRVVFRVSVVGLVLTGFTRVYLGVHYPGDVLAGFVFGGLVAALLLWGWRRRFLPPR